MQPIFFKLINMKKNFFSACLYALVKMGKEAPELEDLQCFVGPPLKEMFMEYAGLTEEEGEQAVAFYRERYVPTGIFENHLYPRINKMLDLFEKEGITMAVASSKPEVFVNQILKHFGIDDYFKVIVGSEMNGSRVHKKDVIEEAVKRLKMENRKDYRQLHRLGGLRDDPHRQIHGFGTSRCRSVCL